MREKFKNKFRIPSARLPNWDYGNPGAYFITICTLDRAFYFGNIKNGKMALSPVGAIADVVWHTIPYHSKNVQLGAFVVMPNHIHGILILRPSSPPVQTLPATSPPNQNQHDHLNIHHDVQTLPATSPLNQNQHGHLNIHHDVQTLQATSAPNHNEHGHLNIHHDEQTLPATSLRDFYGIHNTIDFNEQSGTESPKNEFMAGISPTAGSVSTIIRSYKSAVSRHAHRLGFEFEWQTRFYDNVVRDERAFNNITNYIINNPSKWQEDKFHTII